MIPIAVRERISLLAAITAGLLLAATAAPLDAQVRDGREKDAYLGLSLVERCVAVAGDRICDSPPVIQSVVVSGPADVAGVRTGDVLVSVGGVSVTTPEGREALSRLERGVPVDVSVRREGRLLELEVVPGPLARERQVRLMSGSPRATLEQGDVRTMTIRELDEERSGFTVEIEESDESGQGVVEGSRHFVVVQTDSTGNTVVRVDVPQTFMVDSPDDSGAAAYSWRFVLRDSELAERLQAARQSARIGARARIDSLMVAHGIFSEMEHTSTDGAVWFEEGGAAGFVTVDPNDLTRMARSAPAPAVRKLLEFRNRAAGAEFQPLSPQLAEYFPGADSGLLVLRVIPGTPAARLGLSQGDVVTEIGGEVANDMSVLQRALVERGQSAGVQVKWIRKGTDHTGTLAYP